MFFIYFITKQCLQDFLKCLLPKLSAIRTLRLCRSLCLRHLREIVCFHLCVLPLSVWLLYVVGLLYHSVFRKNHKNNEPPTLFIRKEGRCLRYIPSPYTLLYVKKNLKLKIERAQITFKLTPNRLAIDALLRSYQRPFETLLGIFYFATL